MLVNQFRKKATLPTYAWHTSYTLILSLIKQGFCDEARRVADSLANKANSLESHARMLEFANLLQTPYLEKLRCFLQQLSFRDRAQVLNDFREIANNRDQFSQVTLARIKEVVCSRYREWKPEIDREIKRQAEEQGERVASEIKIVGQPLGCFVQILTFIGLCILLGLASPALRVLIPVTSFAGNFLGMVTIWILFGMISRRVARILEQTRRFGPRQKAIQEHLELQQLTEEKA